MTSTAIPLGMPKVVHYGEGNIFENEPFPEYAKRELKNDQLRNNLRFVTHAIRNKRARVTSELPDWQELRNTGWNSSSVTLPRAAARCTGRVRLTRQTRSLST